MTKTTTIRSIGNSAGTTIPKAMLQRYQLAEGDQVHLIETEDGILITPFDPAFDEAMEIYEECARLGLVVVFHAGRAGIEPEYTHQFTLMRHYEAMLERFPQVQFVFGHAGTRDLASAIPLARRYKNVWLGIHGQGVSALHELIERVGGDRLLFGTDWPFYHLAVSLAKVLIVTRERPNLRDAILHSNAIRLRDAAKP